MPGSSREDGELVTRQTDNGILAGITRQTLKSICNSLQLKFVERPFTLAEAKKAKEAFITSATSFVTPVVKIDGDPVGDGKVGATARRLREEYVRFGRGGGRHVTLAEGLKAHAPSCSTGTTRWSTPGRPSSSATATPSRRLADALDRTGSAGLCPRLAARPFPTLFGERPARPKRSSTKPSIASIWNGCSRCRVRTRCWRTASQGMLRGVVSNKVGDNLRAEVPISGGRSGSPGRRSQGRARDKPAPDPIFLALDGTGIAPDEVCGWWVTRSPTSNAPTRRAVCPCWWVVRNNCPAPCWSIRRACERVIVMSWWHCFEPSVPYILSTR